MKKIIMIVVIGKNGVYKRGGCPLQYNDHRYNDFFRALTTGHPIVLSKSMYDGLPKQSTPFPCRTVYIIGDVEHIHIEPGVTNTTAVFTIEQALAFCEGAEKIIVLADKPLQTEVLEKYADDVQSIIVATVDEAFEGEDLFDQSLYVTWAPLPVIYNGANKKTLHFSIVNCQYSPIFH